MSLPALLNLFTSHIDAHQTERSGQWPNDAEYYVEYRTQTLPDDYVSDKAFFPDAFALTKWYKSQQTSAKSQGNFFEVDALYLWDLGPVLVTDHAPHFNAV